MNAEVTIATQNGLPSREHNLRNPKVVEKEKHIKKDGYHETWLDINPREMYKDLFGPSIAEYNKKQKRRCRQLHNYYGRVEKSARQHPVYEMIAGVYVKNGKMTRDEQKRILQEFVYGSENSPSWEERNPNLILCGLYLHGDEESDDLHLHIDYIPVADGYSTGLEKRSSLGGALEAMGYHHINKKLTRQIQWEASQNQLLEGICKEHQLTVLHPNEGRKHEATEVYKLRMEKKTLREEIEQLKKERNVLSDFTKEVIGPYIRYYMQAIDTVSKIVNQTKKMAAFDELNFTFGFYNIAIEKSMEMVESKIIPPQEDQDMIREGIAKGMAFCECLNEEELTK